MNLNFLIKNFKLVILQVILLKLIFSTSYVLAGNSTTEANSEGLRQLLQLTEYIGVDYASAVFDGAVIDKGEYQEMRDFSVIIADKAAILLSKEPQLNSLAKSLTNAVETKQPIDKIQMLTSELKRLLLKNSPQLSLPKSLLEPIEVKQLFQNNCSNCHGMSGQGDGLLAAQLNPQPTDFTDRSRALDRSIVGLYDVLTGGLDGTAMPSFSYLTAKQRWSLAFYTGGLAFTNSKQTETEVVNLTLADFVQFTPKEFANANSLIELNALEQLRADPARLFFRSEEPLVTARIQLENALIAYQQNDFVMAKQLAVSAYLDGFELVENSLDAYDTSLRKSIESNLLGLRQKLNDKKYSDEVNQSVTVILAQLDQAQRLLTETNMSDSTLFSASFIILLREGLEALLVVIALLSILIRSDKKEIVKYVHFGWISALAAGILTWFAAQNLITISGANRETMEGVAAMLAAVVLFYVGFWMHSKTQANQWQQYVEQNINNSLKTGTLWGISGLAFIAVYREVFETVLFYQSLLTQTSSSQQMVLAGGFGAAVVVLMLLTWLMLRYSIRLPIAKFFSTTTLLLLALSFILAGKAIAALQEAALISISPFPIDFSIGWLGINSTWQGMLVQITILLISAGLLLKPWFNQKLAVQAGQ